MTNNCVDHSLLGLLSYIREEVEQAESVEDVDEVLLLLEAALKERKSVSPVKGLDHINVEYTTPAQEFNVATNVPESLVSTFYDLSDKMNQLHVEDPETFTNASSALHWLANNDKVVS